MGSKTAPIVGLLAVLLLIYLSNSGKLIAIKNLLSSSPGPGPSGSPSTQTPDLSQPPAPGEEDEVAKQINAWLKAHGMVPKGLPPGGIGH